MKYNEFKGMMADLRQMIDKGWDAETITTNLVFDWFWNYESDMPTVNVDQLELAVQNTLRC